MINAITQLAGIAKASPVGHSENTRYYRPYCQDNGMTCRLSKMMEQIAGRAFLLIRGGRTMLNIKHDTNIIKINTRQIRQLGLLKTAAKPNAVKAVQPKTSNEDSTLGNLLNDADQRKPLTAKRAAAIVSFLQEHLTYCDELAEYLLGDKKALAADNSSETLEELATMKLAAQQVTNKLNKLR